MTAVMRRMAGKVKRAYASRFPTSLCELREVVRPGRVEPVRWDPAPALEAVDCLVVMPVGPGEVQAALDTLDSIEVYLAGVSKRVVIVDDGTTDGQRLVAAQRPDWHIIRNETPNGLVMFARTLGQGYKYGLDRWAFKIVLRIDTDALVTGPRLIDEALSFHASNPQVGAFGYHTLAAGDELSVQHHVWALEAHDRRLGRPWHQSQRELAESNGWVTGEAVFGCACFYTYDCMVALRRAGAFDVPTYSRAFYLSEDVFFTMCTVGAGFKLGHFAAPDGPVAVAWQDLPFPPEEITQRGYSLVHSVDKGQWADTAREHFRAQRAGV